MAKKSPQAPRRYPFVLRALFFAAIYTAIATGIDIATQLQQTGTAQTWDWERTYRYECSNKTTCGYAEDHADMLRR